MLPKGSRVLLLSKGTAAVEALREGDRVRTFDERERPREGEVTDVGEPKKRELVKLYLKRGDPVLLAADSQVWTGWKWERASDFKYMNKVAFVHNGRVKTTKIRGKLTLRDDGPVLKITVSTGALVAGGLLLKASS